MLNKNNLHLLLWLYLGSRHPYDCYVGTEICCKYRVHDILYNYFSLSSQVRLGWHDAGTYNKNIEEWPQKGGANGSLRFDIEQKHAANAGMSDIIHLLLSYEVGVNILPYKLDYRACQCCQTVAAYQRQVSGCDLCRFIPIGQCYCCGGYNFLVLIEPYTNSLFGISDNF